MNKDVIEKKIIGEGSYAHVYSYNEPISKKKMAIKKLKRNASDKERERFKLEYRRMHKISNPHIVEVYSYNTDDDSYTMEWCDKTLRKYITENNNKDFMTFEFRKKIVNQFFEALKVIHSKGILHRDLSFNNILVREYDDNTILLKISDFGESKDLDLSITTTNSMIRGTIIDFTLSNYKDYNLKNELFSIGIITNFIFTGKETYTNNHDELSKIIEKCISSDLSNRYEDLDTMLNDINKLENYDKKMDAPIQKEVIVNFTSNSDSNTDLDSLALDMLYNASLSSGLIYKIQTLGGLSIQAGNKNYNPTSPMEEAIYEEVIDNLIADDYIEPQGYKDDLFKLKLKAYKIFQK